MSVYSTAHSLAWSHALSLSLSLLHSLCIGTDEGEDRKTKELRRYLVVVTAAS